MLPLVCENWAQAAGESQPSSEPGAQTEPIRSEAWPRAVQPKSLEPPEAASMKAYPQQGQPTPWR